MVDEAACGGVNEAGGVHEVAFATVPGVVDAELVQVGGGDLRVEAAHHADLGFVVLVAGEGFEAQVVGCVHGEDEVVAVEVLDGEDAGAVRGRVDTAGGELRGGARVDAVAFFFVADAAGGDGDGHAGFLGVLADKVFADGGAADVAGADSHDSVHGSSVSVGWRVVGRGGCLGGLCGRVLGAGGGARGGTLYRGRAKAPPTRGWRGLCAFREITYLSSKWFPFPVREQKLLVLRN